jgi:hypothetical protein
MGSRYGAQPRVIDTNLIASQQFNTRYISLIPCPFT